MFHYYLQRGHELKELMSLSESEKLFYIASMNLELENGAGVCPLRFID